MAMAQWDAIRTEAMICQFTPELIDLDFFDFCGTQMKVTEMDMPQSLKSNLAKKDKDKAFVKNNKTGQITNLRRERNVWMLDLWVKRPADAMDVSSFQRLGR